MQEWQHPQVAGIDKFVKDIRKFPPHTFYVTQVQGEDLADGRPAVVISHICDEEQPPAFIVCVWDDHHVNDGPPQRPPDDMYTLSNLYGFLLALGAVGVQPKSNFYRLETEPAHGHGHFSHN